MRILQRINRVGEKTLDRSIVAFTNTLLFIMTVVIFTEVITRYVFGFAHGQVQEYCILFFVWIVFIMAGKVTKEKKHIIIGLLPERLELAGKLRAKGALDIYISLSLIAFGVTFLCLGVQDTIIYYKSAYHSTLEYVPYYWTRHLALPLGSSILIYYGIRALIQNIGYLVQLNRGGETEPR